MKKTTIDIAGSMKQLWLLAYCSNRAWHLKMGIMKMSVILVIRTSIYAGIEVEPAIK